MKREQAGRQPRPTPAGRIRAQKEKHAAGTLASRRDGDLPLTGQPLDKPIELDRKPTDTLVLIWVTSLTLRDPRFP